MSDNFDDLDALLQETENAANVPDEKAATPTPPAKIDTKEDQALADLLKSDAPAVTEAQPEPAEVVTEDQPTTSEEILGETPPVETKKPTRTRRSRAKAAPAQDPQDAEEQAHIAAGEPVAPAQPRVQDAPEPSFDDAIVERPDVVARVESPTEKIARLQAELDKPIEVPAVQNARPLPEDQLSDEEKQIRILEDKIARKRAEALEAADDVYDVTSGDDSITIYFVEDGFIAQGTTWYRGQVLTFVKGSPAYEQTKDRNGNTWLSLADDEFAQVNTYGKLFFRKGTWAGTGYDDPAAARKEQARNAAAPVVRV